MSDQEIALKVAGNRYGGWKSITVALTMRAACGAFRFEASERYPEDPSGQRIQRGSRAQVLLGDEELIDGWIDEVSPAYSAQGHSVDVRGRDATCDLVDCTTGPAQYAGIRLDTLVRQICAPFDIPVLVEVAIGAAFKRFTIDPGETAFEAIRRACSNRGVLAIADGTGGLRLTRVSEQRAGASLVRGVNIRSASSTLSNAERFATYRVFGQMPGSDAFDDHKTAAQVLGTANDPGIRRHRPLDLLIDESGDATQARERAIWEAATRRGASISVSVDVKGWNHAGGRWRPNTRISMDDDWLGVKRELLIVDVTHTLDDRGRSTNLLLQPPEAYDLTVTPEEALEKKKATKKMTYEGIFAG